MRAELARAYSAMRVRRPLGRAVTTVHPLPGQEDACSLTVERLRAETPAYLMEIRMAGEPLVRFVGGPRDGDTIPLRSVTHSPDQSTYMAVMDPAAVTRALVVIYRLRRAPDGEWLFEERGETPAERIRTLRGDVRTAPAGAALALDGDWQELGYIEEGEVPKPRATGWFRCAADHDEVIWEGTENCWMCGRPGDETGKPLPTDQDIAPYGGM